MRLAPSSQAATTPLNAWHITPVSSLHKLTARTPGHLEPFKAEPVQLHAARGEWECFQIVITAGNQPLNEIGVTPTGLATHLGEYIPLHNVQLFWENYVFVSRPSGNRRLEQLWWPDALIPTSLQPQQKVAPGQSIVVWAAVQVPADAKAGEYYGAVDVTANGETKQLGVSLTVEPITLPKASLRGNVAVYYDVLRDWYKKNLKPLDDDQFARMKRQYYEFVLDYHLNAYDLPVPWNSDEADTYLNDPCVLSVRLPTLGSADLPLALTRLKQDHALHKAYYYWIDEPPPQRYAEVRSTTQQLHAVDAALKHCVTTHPNHALKGAVDIWCPNIGDFFGLGHLDLNLLEAERKQGHETWWYTMVEPKFPYPTWLLDDDASAVRLGGWLMARWGISGFVYSMAHGWGPSPLQNLQSFAGTNGDGTLLYPEELVGGTGPMPSIRLMLLRDAIEDYELLRSLPEAQRAQLTEEIVKGPSPVLHADYDQINWDSLRRKLFAALGGHAVATQRRQDNALWRQLTQEKLSPDNRVIPKTTTLPKIDGQLNDTVWNAKSRLAQALQRIADDKSVTPPPTSLWVVHDAQYLYIAMRCTLKNTTAKGEWVAVDLAPLTSTQRWRFIVRTNGQSEVQRHTREGQFGIEGLKWTSAVKISNGFYNVEIKIPLSVVEDKQSFRLDALRRVNDPVAGTRYTVRLHPSDAGDVYLMPIATLAP